ncbi:MAG: hypothetical protein K8R99_03840 [Actinomycetia bacterium]|nr:hypothetical protein [Actinomycetes bacterium]
MAENTTNEVRYGKVDREYGKRLATTPPDEDGPVWMVNLMSYRDRAEYTDGREGEITGREADDRYSPVGPLKAVGARIVFMADVDTQFFNDTPRWDRIAVAKYPTRRSFIEMQTRKDFTDLHPHKDAGMAATIIAGCQPMPVPALPADAPDWADVPHPPTDDDPPVVVLHVLKFHDPAARNEMATYTDHAAKIAVPHGVHIDAWFAVEGTIVGDGRQWDQIRFNAFPSKAAFMAVALDPERLKAQANHREVALADTYTMILRPTRNQLNEPLT